MYEYSERSRVDPNETLYAPSKRYRVVDLNKFLLGTPEGSTSEAKQR